MLYVLIKPGQAEAFAVVDGPENLDWPRLAERALRHSGPTTWTLDDLLDEVVERPEAVVTFPPLRVVDWEALMTDATRRVYGPETAGR